MEQVLSLFSEPDADFGALFTRLIDEIRPARSDDVDSARRAMQALCYILGSRSDLRTALRGAIVAVGQTLGHSELYVSSGILPNTGFVTELLRRIGHKLLPDVLEPDLLRSLLRRAFPRPDDKDWVMGVGEEIWQQLIQALLFDELPPYPTLPRPIFEILESLRVISYWIAALGTEPELLKLDRSIEEHESPFVAQNVELLAYIGAYRANWRQTPVCVPIIDDKHLHVLYGQCLEAIARVRKNAARDGTSIRLTYHIQRLQQLLRRSEQLLEITHALQREPDGRTSVAAIVRLLMHLVGEECQRNQLRRHWRRNTELIALRITENSGHHGEHYITETRAEYWQMARSAVIGGFIIAFMACFKILLGKAEMPPMTGALAYCLNYGLGFCLIHILHGTVATKQPAMTANAIAASIDEAGGRMRHLEQLTRLIARTTRSQIIAILGNICIAIPLAGLVAYAIFILTGEHFVGTEKAMYLLEEQSPVDSGAVFYAAIAGFCLFLAGLISGYYDNYAAYNRVPERILQLEWPRRLLGEARMRRVSAYIGDNLGSLAGNFFFGFLLGGTTIFGILFGLPIDIRHVAFSSAFVGVAFVALDFAPELSMFLWAATGIALIGFMNLTISFVLALNIALRARQVSDAQWRPMAVAIMKHLVSQPRDFFLPPKGERRTNSVK